MGNLMRKRKRNEQRVDSTANNAASPERSGTELSPDVDGDTQVELPPVTDGLVVRALFDFVALDKGSLAFEKGDVMRADPATLQQDWWTATHLGTRKTGKIPRSYVCKDDASLEARDWWLDADAKHARSESEIVLLLPKNSEGTFLLRRCSDVSVLAVLSVRYEDVETGDPAVAHYKLKQVDDEGLFFFNPNRQFPDVFQLIEHHSRQADGLCTKLTAPYPRIQPVEGFCKLEIDREAIQLNAMLGNGRLGTVCRGELLRSVDVVVRALDTDETDPQAAMDYARVLHQVRHKNLVRLLGVCSSMEPVYFVMEYMPNGSLLDFLRQDSGQLVKLPVIVKMAAQISDGMAYLEAKTIPHLDLRAANVLLGQHYDVKVTDMAMKRIFNEDPFTPTDFKIPLRWMAPEALMYARFTVKSDVWSFGVLLYELNSRGATPYVSLTGRDFVKRVTEGYRLPRPQGCPEPFYEMMTRCWHAEPSQRPTFEYLHSFFGDYNVSTEEKYRQIETEAT